MIRRKYNKLFLITVGIPVILLTCLIGMTGCGKAAAVNSAPVVIPLDVNYVEITIKQLNDAYFSSYRPPMQTDEMFEGKGLVLKNIVIKERMVTSGPSSYSDIYMVVHSIPVKHYLLVDAFRFEPQDPSALKGLEVGQVVDIAGVFVGYSLELNVVVIINCLIEPAGQLPLPFAGAEIMEISGY